MQATVIKLMQYNTYNRACEEVMRMVMVNTCASANIFQISWPKQDLDKQTVKIILRLPSNVHQKI